MPVIFDEVVGEVEPDAAPPAEAAAAPPSEEEPTLAKQRQDLRRVERRDARLRAD